MASRGRPVSRIVDLELQKGAICPHTIGWPYFGLPSLPVWEESRAHHLVNSLGEERFPASAIVNWYNRFAGNALPTELLIEIMHFVREGEGASWTRMLLVCRRWFFVGSTTATLWDRPMALANVNNLLRTSICRSGSLNLQLAIDGNTLMSSATRKLFQVQKRCPEGTVPMNFRLRQLMITQLTIDNRPTLPEVLHWLPALEVLYVRSKPCEKNAAVALYLDADRLPRLKTVATIGLYLCSTSTALTGLREITMKATPYGILNVPKLETLLRSCTSLESLSLGEISTQPSFEGGPRIVIPTLSSVKLQGHWSFIQSMISVLHIPAHVNLEAHHIVHSPVVPARVPWGAQGLALLLPAPADGRHLQTLPLLGQANIAQVRFGSPIFSTHFVITVTHRQPDAPSALLCHGARRMGRSATFEVAPAVWCDQTRRSFARDLSITHETGLFLRYAPLEELVVVVDVDEDLLRVDWIMLLGAIGARLRKLTIHILNNAWNTGLADPPQNGVSCSSVWAVVGALSPNHAGATLCPRLQALWVTGFKEFPGYRILREMDACITSRLGAEGLEQKLDDVLLRGVWKGAQGAGHDAETVYEGVLGPKLKVFSYELAL